MNARKVELAALQKKEGGNLNARDFTDDIYVSPKLNKSMFVEGKMEGSDLFTNLLVVVVKNKYQIFANDLNSVMPEYYENLDKNDHKRINDQSIQRLEELRHAGGQVWTDFVAHYELMGLEGDKFEEKAR